MTDAAVGVVILTHGPAGADMVATLGRLLGPAAIDGFVAVEVRIGEPKAEVNADLVSAVRSADRGAGVLVCCDLHGSTPANCAVDLMRTRLPDIEIAVISGVSMPMLMKRLKAITGSKAFSSNCPRAGQRSRTGYRFSRPVPRRRWDGRRVVRDRSAGGKVGHTGGV